MKTLLLLRHAKSSWNQDELHDHERPLNKRGKKDSRKIGCLLAEADLLPELIVSSSARRCRRTAEEVIHHSGYRGDTQLRSELYEADSAKLRSLLSTIDGGVGRLLIIAHNPGLEEFLESLVGSYTRLQTAAMAQVVLTIDAWSGLSNDAQANLVKVWQASDSIP
jgi:phosphohistidine phosphatase